MDFTTLQNILITYIPAISVIIGLVATCFGFMKNFKSVIKKSNLEEIRSQITDSNSELNQRIDFLLTQISTLNEQNADLKKRNNELIGEIKRIAGYGKEE